MGKTVKNKGKIDVIIPAYKAQGTILRTLSSIAEQTILSDLTVIIVNDACPNGDYKKFVDMFSPYISIKEVKLDVNGGPGVARQRGIDEGDSEFFTCIDADDTFYGAVALEGLRACIEARPNFMCASGRFLQLGEDVRMALPHDNDMVWMFGKLYRRSFIEKYKIMFNETRANEDTGFNKWVQLLCDNPNEQITFTQTPVYCWHNKVDSITRINDGQYQYDQCLCGWTDNMIYAIKNAKKSRPFSGAVTQSIVGVMLNLYYYWIETVARKPVFADQNWEYIKKFYHVCYKRIEEDITDEVFSQMYSVSSMEKWGHGDMLGIVPHIGIKEFMDKLKTDPYDENHIYEVWEKMEEDPETKKLIESNERCGVCPKGYTNKPF